LRVFTTLGVLAAFSPATTVRALFFCKVSVLLSRTARFWEYAHTARHDFSWTAGSQTGSARLAESLLLITVSRWSRGVMVSMTWPSVKTVPCQRKWDSRSLGAFVTREPTMNRNPVVEFAQVR